MEPMSDLRSLLLEHGLRPKRMNPGAQSRLRCPACEAKDEDSFSLKIDADGQGFTGNCHRGSCGHSMGARVHEDEKRYPSPKPQRERSYALPKPVILTPESRGPDVYAWFAKRGIDSDVVDDFGVYLKAGHRFGKTIGDAIVFPYRYRAEIVNRKYRGVADKRLQMQETNPLPTLFNVDSVIDHDVVIWAEG